jgi:hypothetical protein
MSTDPDIKLPDLASPGIPPSFRDRIADALRTTDPAVLDAAEQDCRGAWPDLDAYVRTQLAEHLPSHMAWLLDCCDPAKIRAGYENGAVFLWTVPLPDGGVLLFESQHDHQRRRTRG